jgi:hypothetical protein
MYAHPVKPSVARRVQPLIPNELDYPATRQSAVTLPSRIARDHTASTAHVRLLIEIGAMGGDVQWVLLPTVKFLAKTLTIHHSTVSRYLYDLANARYIELKVINRMQRYARIALPGYALDWE